MQEEWQIAINHWDKWRDSVESTRAMLLKKYGDLKQLDECLLELSYQADTGSLPQDSVTEYRKLSLDMWNIYNDVDSIGVKFIQDNLGLQVGSVYLNKLLEYHTHSVIPELTKDWDDKRSLGKYFLDVGLVNIFRESKIDTRRGKEEILDSVSWYRGKVDTAEIIKIIRDDHLLTDMPSHWPSEGEIKKTANGGRPSQESEIAMESILCYVFYHKHKMSQPKIAKMFGWDTRKGSYDKWVSSTFKKRLAQGNKLMNE